VTLIQIKTDPPPNELKALMEEIFSFSSEAS